MARPLEERFWENVDRDGPVSDLVPDLGSCWLWTAGKSEGYGIISVDKTTRLRSHQVSWMLHGLGEVPRGLVIRHRCGVRLCVNPEHLQLGTRAQNNQDTHDMGRWYWVAPGHGRRRGPPQRRGKNLGRLSRDFGRRLIRTAPSPHMILALDRVGSGQVVVRSLAMGGSSCQAKNVTLRKRKHIACPML